MRKSLVIICQAAILCLIYIAGTFIVETFQLPIPGSVIGMIILFILLLTNIIKPLWIQEGANFFISNLNLFFIPATVGIMNYLDFFAGKGFLLVLITIISTFLVILSSGAVSQWLISRKEKKYD